MFFFRYLTWGSGIVAEIVNTAVFYLIRSEVRSTPIVTWVRSNQLRPGGGNTGVVSTSAAGGREGGLPVIRASWPGLIACRPNRYIGDRDGLSAACTRSLRPLYSGVPVTWVSNTAPSMLGNNLFSICQQTLSSVWDLKLSLRWILRLRSSQMWRSVSEGYALSIFSINYMRRVNKFLRNVST